MTEDDPLDALKKRKQAATEGDDPLLELKKRQAARTPTVSPVFAPRETTTARLGSKPQDTAGPLGFLAPVAQGLTLGGADEILGAVEGANQAMHGGSFSKGYEEGRDKVRAGTKKFADQNPVTSTALTIAGGVAPALLGPGASLVKAGTPLLRRIGLSAAEGAGIGGVAGGLSADDNRAAGAVGGAVVGGGLGGLIPVAGAGVGLARNVIGRKGGQAAKYADNLILRALDRDRATPGSVSAPPGKPTILADLAGENTLGLARGAQAAPSQAKNALADFLHERQAGQPSRVLGDLESAAGMESQNVHDVAERLIETRKANAKPLYDKVRDVVVNDPEVVGTMAESPYFRAAHKIGRQIAKEEGVKLPALEKVTVDAEGKEVRELIPQTIQAIDYTKRGLDALIERKYRSGGMDKNLARVLKNKLRGVLEMVDNAVPDYQAARQQFAGDSELIDALEAGRNFLKDDSRLTAKELSRMTDGEREMHRVGAIDAIRQKLDETPDGADVVKRLFGNPRKREQLKVLLGDDAFSALDERLGVESKMFRTKATVLGGSPTARIQAELGDLEEGGNTIRDIATSRKPVRTALAKVYDAGVRRAGGNVGEVADAVSKRVMLRPGTPEYQAWLHILSRMQSDASRASLPRNVARRALIAGVTNRE